MHLLTKYRIHFLFGEFPQMLSQKPDSVRRETRVGKRASRSWSPRGGEISLRRTMLVNFSKETADSYIALGKKREDGDRKCPYNQQPTQRISAGVTSFRPIYSFAPSVPLILPPRPGHGMMGSGRETRWEYKIFAGTRPRAQAFQQPSLSFQNHLLNPEGCLANCLNKFPLSFSQKFNLWIIVTKHVFSYFQPVHLPSLVA
jgi:hypothetical protein